MRETPPEVLEDSRTAHPTLGDSEPLAMWGFFLLRLRSGIVLRILSSGPDAWEHVSVSAVRRGTVMTPTWSQMALVKSLFWDDEETVVQFHPKRSEYVNTHPHCLHLWKQAGTEYQLPPRDLVG